MENKTGFTVYEVSNRRGNEVSEDEIKQAITDMAGWFSTNAKDVAAELKSKKGASSDDIAKLEKTVKTKLPRSLAVLLSVYDGGLLLKDNYKSLSVSAILDAIDVGQVNGYWKANYIPFAGDDDNNFLCMEHTSGAETKIVAWCTDMGVIEEVADGLGLLIERVRDGLLKKKVQYIEGAGLVEDSS